MSLYEEADSPCLHVPCTCCGRGVLPELPGTRSLDRRDSRVLMGLEIKSLVPRRTFCAANNSKHLIFAGADGSCLF
jgi:hypothetical protein